MQTDRNYMIRFLFMNAGSRYSNLTSAKVQGNLKIELLSIYT